LQDRVANTYYSSNTAKNESKNCIALCGEYIKPLQVSLFNNFSFSSKCTLIYNSTMSVDKVIIRAGNGINILQIGDKVIVTFMDWLYNPDQAGKGKEYAVNLDLMMPVIMIA
jgi:hypothetical protein